MAIGDYSTTRDSNASIAPGDIRSNDYRRDQQIINSIRQLMMDLAVFINGPTFDGSITTNGQLIFPATQNASADVNTLDDYEEGTWTPTLRFGGASVGITYSNQVGSYIKIGRLVRIGFDITLTSKGTSTGAATVIGVPFTTGSNAGDSAELNAVSFGNMATLTANPFGIIGVSSTSMALRHSNTTGAVDLNDTNFTNTTFIRMAGTYLASG